MSIRFSCHIPAIAALPYQIINLGMTPAATPGEPGPAGSAAMPAATRARSMFVSLWGDVLAPHGDQFWLSGIIALARALDLSERLVRTTLFRLSGDGWLESTRIGRQSRYGLTGDGTRRVAHASKRIYGANLPSWSGYWSLVLEGPAIGASRRQLLEQDLKWQGFAPFAAGLYAQPERDASALEELLASTGMSQAVTRFRAQCLPGTPADALVSTIHHAYGLGQVAARYREFIDQFANQLDQLAGLQPASAFALRVRLIHEFRRVLLIDPELPHALLPADWPGHRAYQLARILYTRLLPLSETFVVTTLGKDAAVDSASIILQQRFPAKH